MGSGPQISKWTSLPNCQTDIFEQPILKLEHPTPKQPTGASQSEPASVSRKQSRICDPAHPRVPPLWGGAIPLQIEMNVVAATKQCSWRLAIPQNHSLMPEYSRKAVPPSHEHVGVNVVLLHAGQTIDERYRHNAANHLFILKLADRVHISIEWALVTKRAT